jgi:hypothetical protein
MQHAFRYWTPHRKHTRSGALEAIDPPGCEFGFVRCTTQLGDQVIPGLAKIRALEVGPVTAR